MERDLVRNTVELRDYTIFLQGSCATSWNQYLDMNNDNAPWAVAGTALAERLVKIKVPIAKIKVSLSFFDASIMAICLVAL